MRVYRYLVLSKVALAVDTQPGKPTRLAVTVCNPADKYSRPAARFILNAMLDESPETLRAVNLRANVFNLTYAQSMANDSALNALLPARDIIRPLLDVLEPVLSGRMGSFKNGKTVTWKQRAEAVIKAASTFARDHRQKTRPTPTVSA